MTQKEGVEIIRATGKDGGVKVVGGNKPELKGIKVVPNPLEEKDDKQRSD